MPINGKPFVICGSRGGFLLGHATFVGMRAVSLAALLIMQLVQHSLHQMHRLIETR